MRQAFNLGDIEAFIAIAEHNSFRKAAEALALSPPALSRRLSKLEDTLGVKLVERTTRSVSLTTLGREFHLRGLDLLVNLENSLLLLRDVDGRRSSILTIACVRSVTPNMLPVVVDKFARALPQVKLRILDLSSLGVLNAVVEGEAEVGLNFIGSSEPGVDFTQLFNDPFVVATNRSHPLGEKPVVGWQDLRAYPTITATKGSGNRLLIDATLAAAGIDLPWTFEVRHIATSLGLVERGIGVAVVPRSALPADDHPFLRSSALEGPSLMRKIGLCTRQNTRLTSAAQVFFQMAVDEWGTGN